MRAGALVAVAVLAAAPAHAQPDDATRAKAAQLFVKGSAHYEAGRFSDAIPLFREAYELVRDPVYLFNLAQAYRKVLDCESAAHFYERYLIEAIDADAQQRARVEGWLRELAPCVEERRTTEEAARKARAKADAAERARLIAEARQGQTDQTIDRGRWYRVGGYVLAGAGAVGIGLGIRYSIRGRDLERELDAACANGCDWADPALRAKDAEGERANRRSTIGYVAGGLALAGGITLYIIGRSKIEHVDVSLADGGATVTTRVAF